MHKEAHHGCYDCKAQRLCIVSPHVCVVTSTKRCAVAELTARPGIRLVEVWAVKGKETQGWRQIDRVKEINRGR